MMPSSFKRILQTPKRYVLNFKDDLLALKCNKASVITFVKKYPLLSLKVLHSTYLASAQAYCCRCSIGRYHLFDIIPIINEQDRFAYKCFFSYLVEFEKEYCNNNNIYSPCYKKDNKTIMPYSEKYFLYPFLTFFSHIYTFFKTKKAK